MMLEDFLSIFFCIFFNVPHFILSLFCFLMSCHKVVYCLLLPNASYSHQSQDNAELARVSEAALVQSAMISEWVSQSLPLPTDP